MIRWSKTRSIRSVWARSAAKSSLVFSTCDRAHPSVNKAVRQQIACYFSDRRIWIRRNMWAVARRKPRKYVPPYHVNQGSTSPPLGEKENRPYLPRQAPVDCYGYHHDNRMYLRTTGGAAVWACRPGLVKATPDGVENRKRWNLTG